MGTMRILIAVLLVGCTVQTEPPATSGGGAGGEGGALDCPSVDAAGFACQPEPDGVDEDGEPIWTCPPCS